VVVSTDLRQTLGVLGERLAAEHFERLGYAVVARRYRTRYGEIDLIVADADTVVFVEVKARRGQGRPWEAMTAAKRLQVRRMARAWLASEPDRPRRRNLRFDAVGITVDGQHRLVALDHLEGAF
jgi:putative endonuclease